MPKKRSHTYRVCRTTGKRMFRDDIAAALALEAIQLRGRRTIHDESRYYTCKFCRQVHLTSEDQRTELQGMKHSA